MTKKELLQKAGSKRYWTLDRLVDAGAIVCEKDASGRRIYTEKHLEIFKKYNKNRGL